MEPSFRSLLLLLSLSVTVAAEASTNAAIDILVTKEPSAAVVHRGSTDAKGAFSTGDLQPGAYVVQFTSRKAAALKGSELSIDIGGGKRAMRATAVPGEKLAGGGVAMKVEVARASRLSGQVASALRGNSVATATKDSRRNVKTMNGRTYVWVPGGIETRIGGKWIEESDAPMSSSNGKAGLGDAIRGMQEGRGTPFSGSSGTSLEIIDNVGTLHPNPLLFAASPAPGPGK